MSKHLRKLIIIAALCLPWMTNAQTHYNLQIGEGTATNSYVPTYGLFNYSYTQSLYTAGDVGIDGIIDTIAYEVYTGNQTRTLTIYMAEVSQTTLSSAIPASSFQQVFSGSVSLTPGWRTIALDTAFEYQDTGSLVIAVIDGTGTWTTAPVFYGTQMSDTRAQYVYNDNNTYTLSSSMTNTTSFRPNIRLGISSYNIFCAQPSNVAVTNIDYDSAHVSWTENGGATEWEVIVSDSVVTDLANAFGTIVYDNNYTVTGLSGNTLYYVYVRAVCDASTYSGWTNAVSFRSACMGTTSIPYSTGFEGLATGAMPNCWQQIATGTSGAGTFPSAYAYANNARNGNVYFEFESSNGQTEIAALPEMDYINTLMLTFYASCMNTNFVLEAGVMDGTTFDVVDTITLTPGSSNNWHGSYNPYTVYYNNYNGSGNRLALRVTASGSYTLMMDELTVDYIPSCPPPSNGSIDSTGNNWVAFSWQENGTASSWEVAYGTGSFVPNSNTSGMTVYDTYYTLSGLSGDSSYAIYVRSNCGSSDYSNWVLVGTARPGIYVMTLPSDTLYACGVTIYDNGGPDGNYSNSSNNTLVVYPNDVTQTLQISGTGNVESGYDHLYIYDGVGTSGTQLFHGQNAFTMPATNSEEGALTIVFTSDGSVQYSGYELVVSCIPLPSCVNPSYLTVGNVGTQTADISWTERGTATTWIVQYDTVNFTPGDNTTATSILVSTDTYTLSGLDSGMTYYVYVAAYCNPDSSAFIGTSFTTLAATPASLPYSCDFEQPGVNGWDLINGTEANHWMVGSGASNGGTRGLYITNDNTSNGYSTSSTSVVFASRTLYFDSVGEYAYSFDWRADGESSWDYIRVALVPTTVDLTAGTLGSWGTSSLPSGAIALDGGTKLNQVGSWTNRNGTVNITNTGAYNLVFLWRNDGSGGTQPPAAIDNVMLARLTCPSPANLAITRLTSDSVFLAWNGNGVTGPWLLTYSGNTTMVFDSTAAIGGLTAGTPYTFSVATICGSDTALSVSIQATPGSWTMRPNMTDTLHMCGGVIYDDGGANGSYSSSQSSIIILYPDAPNNLVSLSGTVATETCCDYLTIYDGVGTSGAVLFDGYGTVNVMSNNGPLTLEFYSDVSVQSDGFALTVSCISVSCRVMNLQLNPNVPESGSQLAVTWDAVTDAQSYQIEYGNAGFAQGSGWTMNTLVNSATITGLTSMTNYDVYVRSICSGGDTGSWTQGTFTTAMCDNPVVAYSYDTAQVAGQSSYMPIGHSYYNNSYVQTIIPASYLADVTGDITAIAFHPANTSASNQFAGMSVYLANISEDRFTDEEFFVEDANHHFTQVISDADFSYSSTDWQIHGFDSAFVWDGQSNVLVAIIRENGNYASGALFSSHTDTIARTCYDYDDYEEYDLTYTYGSTSNSVGDLQLISCGGGCPRPGALNATNVSFGSATLNWSGSSQNYEIAIKRANEGTWPAETAVTGTTYNATGLYAATMYQFRVRTICDASAGEISDWTVSSFVTDSLPCFDPSDFENTAVTYNSATFNWTVNGEETMWNVHVWNTAFDSNYVVNAHPATVGGLAQNVAYYAAVSALCGGGAAESEFSDTIQFTTATCQPVTNATATSVTAHTAVITWNGNATSYDLEYGRGDFGIGTGTQVNGITSTSYTLTDLVDEAAYTVYIRANCEGQPSAWSQVQFTTAVGIDGVNGVNVTIYPNPTTTSTTIALSGITGEVSIAIVDMNGRTVRTDAMSCEGDCVKTIEVSGLAQGAYFVRVNGEGVNMVKKLVVK